MVPQWVHGDTEKMSYAKEVLVENCRAGSFVIVLEVSSCQQKSKQLIKLNQIRSSGGGVQ